MKKIISIICFSCLLLSCKNKPVDGRLVFAEPVLSDTIFLKGKPLNDSFIMTLSLEIDFRGDNLFITTRANGKMLHIFDKHSGNYVNSAISFGRGPGEILDYQQQTQILPSGECFVLEKRPKRLTQYDFDSLLVGKLSFDNIEYPFDSKVFTERAFRVKDGWLAYETVSKLYKDEIPPRRFTYVKDDGATYYYDKYPVSSPDAEENENIVNQYRSYQKMVFSPDRTRMAVGESYGAILEIFDLRDSVELKTVRPFYDPKDFKNMRGFIDMYATDKYIYAILVGNTGVERCCNIVAFDWNGKPAKIYKTDINLAAICVDEEEKKIYANIIQDETGICNIYEFDMDVKN